jgi:septum site-determining protein MinC
MRIMGRSYMAFVFTPMAPLDQWLAELDAWLERFPGFFVGRPVVLNLANLSVTGAEIAHLTAALAERSIGVMGIEGADPSQLGPDLPPALRGGLGAEVEAADAAPAARNGSAHKGPEPASLLIDRPVRSGQSIIFPQGDVSIIGSVGFGAEIVAGGSIHIYGTLRGRALAGSTGNRRARIFCQKIDAELLAIDGYYTTAEEIDPTLRSRPVQVRLEGETVKIEALN